MSDTDKKRDRAEYKREWARRNAAKIRVRAHERYLANAEEVKKKAREWRINNPDKAKEQGIAKKKANPEKYKEIARCNSKKYYQNHKEEKSLYGKKWHEANKERINKDAKVRAKIWREENPDRAKSALMAWRRANPERIRTLHAERRARKKNAIIETFSALDIYERDGWVCQICHKKVNRRLKYPNPLSPSLDHIVPLAQGGAHSSQNAQLAHWICNVRTGVNGIKQTRLLS